jgi:hypothetical protein
MHQLQAENEVVLAGESSVDGYTGNFKFFAPPGPKVA